MMKNLLISLIVSAGLVSVAHAGDIEAGKAKSATCAACHGVDGNSMAPTFPKIAGQGERYLNKQIKDIRDGRRQAAAMMPFVMGLTDDDIADLSAYFAAQAPTNSGADEALAAKGERIYRAGIEEKGIPACLACHGPAGKGVEAAGFPRLAGQHAAYTQDQLTKFSKGERANDGDSRMMRDIAYRLHSSEIEAVSSYIAGLR
jgi:cbb3-type cytochrome c oxidase subunit III